MSGLSRDSEVPADSRPKGTGLPGGTSGDWPCLYLGCTCVLLPLIRAALCPTIPVSPTLGPGPGQTCGWRGRAAPVVPCLPLRHEATHLTRLTGLGAVVTGPLPAALTALQHMWECHRQHLRHLGDTDPCGNQITFFHQKVCTCPGKCCNDFRKSRSCDPQPTCGPKALG